MTLTVSLEEREKKTLAAFSGTTYWGKTTLFKNVTSFYKKDDEEKKHDVDQENKHNKKQRVEEKTKEINQQDFFWEPLVERANEYNDVIDILQWSHIEKPLLREELRLYEDEFPKPPPVQEIAKIGDTSFLTKELLQIPFVPIVYVEKEQGMTEESKLSEIKTMSQAALETLVKHLARGFEDSDTKRLAHSNNNPLATPYKILQRIFHTFNIREDQEIDFRLVTTRFRYIILCLSEIQQRCEHSGQELEGLLNRCTQLIEAYKNSYNILLLQTQLFSNTKLREMPDYKNFFKNIDPNINFVDFGLTTIRGQPKELNEVQRAYIWYLRQANEAGLFKGGRSRILKPKKQENGQEVFDYEDHCSTHEFITRPTTQGQNQELWGIITKSKHNLPNLVTLLEKIENDYLPTLQKDRTFFGFKEGLYSTQYDRFLPWDEVNSLPFKSNKIAIAKYHDLFFANEYCELILAKAGGDWYYLPTPYTSKIFDAQGFPEDVKRFVYMCMGRMLQQIGTDNWQFMLWCIGKSGTGKSSFTSLWYHIYSQSDVGTMNQIVEPQFGVSQFFTPAPKMVVVGNDLCSGLGIPLQIFLNWMSGESGTLPVKHKEAFECQMNVPFIASSNVIPFKDVSKAWNRRCALLFFHKEIKKSSPQLVDHIVKFELPILIKKCTLAYWDFFRRHGNDKLENFRPAYFDETGEELAKHSNSIHMFLRTSNRVRIISAKEQQTHNEHDLLMTCPVDDIAEQYNQWKNTELSKDEAKRALPWLPEHYLPVFADLKCTLFQYDGVWPPDLKTKLTTLTLMVKNCVTAVHHRRYASCRNPQESSSSSSDLQEQKNNTFDEVITSSQDSGSYHNSRKRKR